MTLIALVACSQHDGSVAHGSAQLVGDSPVTVSTDLSDYAPAATITVAYDGLPGNYNDWIAIAPAGSDDHTYLDYAFTLGQATGTVTFAASASNGSFVARAYSNNSYVKIGETPVFTVSGAATTPSVSTDLASYNVGDTITVTYAALPGNYVDWISLAPAGASDNTYLQYAYTLGQKSGAVTFTAPTNGSYVARAYVNNTYTKLAESTSFAVVGGVPPALSTDAPSYAPGDTVTITYSGMPGNYNDWISIAASGSDDTAYVLYVFTQGQLNGTATFTAPGNGSYVARAYANNTYTKLVQSAAFIVSDGVPSTLSTDASSYMVGDTITVTYSGMPGNTTDWVAIAPAGSANVTYQQYVFTSGQKSGTATFTATETGTFVARSFPNNTFNLLAESTPAFEVSSSADGGTD